jgi:hypothetical protein
MEFNGLKRHLFLVLLFLILGFLILFEQYLNYNTWFQIKDIHHETFALSSFAISLGIAIGYKLKK